MHESWGAWLLIGVAIGVVSWWLALVFYDDLNMQYPRDMENIRRATKRFVDALGKVHGDKHD